MKQKTDLTLPEWVFLDGNSHLGDTLEGRTVLQHIRSYTMIEVLALQDLEFAIKPEFTTREFTYKNTFGIIEQHLFIVHFSLAADFELAGILDKAAIFYIEYLTWEDKNIITEDNSKHN